MANAKPKLYSAVTPRGVAVYPRLNKPDTKFNAAGVFSTKLVLSGEDAAPLMEAIKAEAEAAFEQAKVDLAEKLEEAKPKDKPKIKLALESVEPGPMPFEPEYDDDGEETGNYIFGFKTNASYKDRKTEKVVNKTVSMFDRKGKQIAESVKPQIWGGSVIKVDFAAAPYYNASAKNAGVSLRINSVQLISVVSGGTTSRFGEEEGDYEAPEAEEGTSKSHGSESEQSGEEGENDDF